MLERYSGAAQPVPPGEIGQDAVPALGPWGQPGEHPRLDGAEQDGSDGLEGFSAEDALQLDGEGTGVHDGGSMKGG